MFTMWDISESSHDALGTDRSNSVMVPGPAGLSDFALHHRTASKPRSTQYRFIKSVPTASWEMFVMSHTAD